MNLRPYQQETLDAILREYQAGVHQQLVVKATGTGKTVDFANLPTLMRPYLPGKMLVFAHREELINQSVKKVQDWNPSLRVGKEMAEDYADISSDVVVSCVQSIGREGATRLQRFGEFDIVICDEAHHSIASTYMNVFEMTGVLKPDTKKLLVGFTATPKRKNLTRNQQKQITTLDEGDLLSLKSVYRKIVYKYTIRQAIRDGWLVPMRGFRLKTGVDLSGVKIQGGDYQEAALTEVINIDIRNNQIVKMWLDYAEGRSTVGFTAGIEHAKELARVFQQAGVKADAVWGNDPLRADKLKRHQDRGVDVLFNAALLVEGYDDWHVSCILDTAPTKSGTVYTQRIGRGTRLQEGTGNLLEAIKAGILLEKKDCYVLSAVDNDRRCSLVTLPSLLGLSPEFDLHGESVTKAAEEIEELQAKHPELDFTKLTDLSNVKAYVESLDLFAEPYTDEVKEFSALTWMQTQDGAYVLAIPERKSVSDARQFYNYQYEKLHITENELGEFVLSKTDVQTDRELGIFNTLQEAFTTADDVMLRCRPDRMRTLYREATWHKNPASDAAKRYLRKLSKKKPMLYCLCENVGTSGTCSACGKPLGITAGQASLALSKLKTK